MAEKGKRKNRSQEERGANAQTEKTANGREEANAQAKANEWSGGSEGAPREPWQMEDTSSNEVSVPAIHHVGPTLESDPEFYGLATGGQTPEAQIAEQGATAVPDVREMIERGLDPLSGLEREAGEGERLRTRLPGDTSSDTHTDVGSDNAATVQRRGEAQPGEQEKRGRAQAARGLRRWRFGFGIKRLENRRRRP
jgi:hypothetical protein